jgi:hypothetical protein
MICRCSSSFRPLALNSSVVCIPQSTEAQAQYLRPKSVSMSSLMFIGSSASLSSGMECMIRAVRMIGCCLASSTISTNSNCRTKFVSTIQPRMIIGALERTLRPCRVDHKIKFQCLQVLEKEVHNERVVYG